MKILVTGGTGTVGRETVKRLVSHGHDVLVIGRRQGMTIEGAEYRACDINDFAGIRNAVRGCEGIVHLAAIPNPSLGPGHEVFRVNASGTYNIFEAAAQEGIKRVVSTSSINAFGYFFGVKSFPLRYFPIDEDHETYTTDPYSFSKQIIEEIGHYYWRREGISSISMRLPGVYEVGGPRMARRLEHQQAMQAHLSDLLAMPENERRHVIDEAVRHNDEVVRKARFFEQPRDRHAAPPQGGSLMGPMIGQRNNFWASIDARDSAQAIELGLTVDYQGCHTLFINDSHNSTGYDTRLLTDSFFPSVPWNREPVDDESLVSIQKAQDLLGFHPEFHSPGRIAR